MEMLYNTSKPERGRIGEAMNIAKWAIAIVAVAALIFSAIQTSSLRTELTEQKSILADLRQSQKEINSTLQETSDELTNAIAESEKKLGDILNSGIDIRSGSPLETTGFHQPSGIVWSYGTGLPGRGEGELFTPHMIEDLGDGNLLVPEQMNHDVIIINKHTNKIVWQFGDRFTRGKGTGNLLAEPISAHQIPSGKYKGDFLITEMYSTGETDELGRILIVDYQTKQIEWEKTVNTSVLDAIP